MQHEHWLAHCPSFRMYLPLPQFTTKQSQMHYLIHTYFTIHLWEIEVILNEHNYYQIQTKIFYFNIKYLITITYWTLLLQIFKLGSKQDQDIIRFFKSPLISWPFLFLGSLFLHKVSWVHLYSALLKLGTKGQNAKNLYRNHKNHEDWALLVTRRHSLGCKVFLRSSSQTLAFLDGT